MSAQLLWYSCSVFRPKYSLRTSSASSWSGIMARRPRFAWRFEHWIWVISPNICWLLPPFPILTIGYRIPRYALHEIHFPHSATRILDEIVFWFKLADEVNYVFVCFVTEFCILCDWFQVPIFSTLSVMRNCSDTVRCAVWACPNNIRMSEFLNDFLRS